MHKTVAESAAAARRLSRLLSGIRRLEVVIAPSCTALQSVGATLKGTRLRLAAQNLHWENEGAFTGEVSPVQLKEVGCRYVLIGHSERRRLFGETDNVAGRKVSSALRQGLNVIFCIGETLEQRRADQTAAVVREQLEKGLADVTGGSSDRIAIAYEPVWAIGTGQTAAALQISGAHEMIRRQLTEIFGPDSSEAIRVLYGGSVTSDNIAELAGIKNLDGVLVGGASLQTDGFAAIVKILDKMKRQDEKEGSEKCIFC
ncbi:MAG: triose-phosphate isomerase [Nitrospirae bacterium]|nr:triose-phosphate isomerase [Nitrospirota bacterium]